MRDVGRLRRPTARRCPGAASTTISAPSVGAGVRHRRSAAAPSSLSASARASGASLQTQCTWRAATPAMRGADRLQPRQQRLRRGNADSALPPSKWSRCLGVEVTRRARRGGRRGTAERQGRPGGNPRFYGADEIIPPMTITIKTAADIDGMRVAGRLASEVLDMLTPHVEARRHHRAARQARARPHRQRAGRHAGAAELRAARLHALPEVDLHVDQPPGLPRHPERPAAEERRHRQHRRHRHQGRLARRHQPHVHRRRRLDRRQAPVPDHLRGDVEGHRQGQARRAPRRHRPRDPDLRREQRLLGRARVLRPRHRPQASTRSRRCCTTAARARSKSWCPA